MKRAYQLADHKIEIKESEREKYLNLARVQKKKQNKKKKHTSETWKELWYQLPRNISPQNCGHWRSE